MSARDSPKLFAACHVLHRLLAPRHPPRALCSLTTTATHQAVSCHVANPKVRQSEPVYVHSRPGMHLAHNSAKLKIFNLPKHYPVVKVRPCGLDRSRGTGPSDPLVGELMGPRIRGAVSVQTPNDGSIVPSRRVNSDRVSSSLGHLAPIFSSLPVRWRQRFGHPG